MHSLKAPSTGLGCTKQQQRVASLSPKHASGRVRRALRCQAALTASGFMGQRVQSAQARVVPGRRAAAPGRSGRLVVKSMWVPGGLHIM